MTPVVIQGAKTGGQKMEDYLPFQNSSESMEWSELAECFTINWRDAILDKQAKILIFFQRNPS